MKISKRTFTRYKKRVLKSHNWLLAGGLVILVIVMTINSTSTSSFNSSAYAPLLNVIARGESGGNYNAHFSNPANMSLRFTDMTIEEVLQWQSDYVNKGNFSSAVGKYQIIRPTLVDLINKLNIDPNTKFDESTQDRLAIALLERRGANEYANKKLTREEFAANLAKEWAALPKATGSNPEESYYGGDGVNKSNVTVNEVFAVLDTLLKSAEKNG